MREILLCVNKIVLCVNKNIQDLRLHFTDVFEMDLDDEIDRLLST